LLLCLLEHPVSAKDQLQRTADDDKCERVLSRGANNALSCEGVARYIYLLATSAGRSAFLHAIEGADGQYERFLIKGAFVSLLVFGVVILGSVLLYRLLLRGRLFGGPASEGRDTVAIRQSAEPPWALGDATPNGKLESKHIRLDGMGRSLVDVVDRLNFLLVAGGRRTARAGTC
jgi:hypothetical protein